MSFITSSRKFCNILVRFLGGSSLDKMAVKNSGVLGGL